MDQMLIFGPAGPKTQFSLLDMAVLPLPRMTTLL